GGPAVLTNYTAVEEAMLALIEAFIISGLPGPMKMRQMFLMKGGGDVEEPTPGPSGIASPPIMESEVIVTMDENTLEEQEVTVPIVTMDYTLRNYPIFSQKSNYKDGFSRDSAVVQEREPFQELSRCDLAQSWSDRDPAYLSPSFLQVRMRLSQALFLTLNSNWRDSKAPLVRDTRRRLLFCLGLLLTLISLQESVDGPCLFLFVELPR
ncbi:hypothetical protein C7M84_016718, partial [Penaeus vannamei]